jgi:hypothetical protein
MKSASKYTQDIGGGADYEDGSRHANQPQHPAIGHPRRHVPDHDGGGSRRRSG